MFGEFWLQGHPDGSSMRNIFEGSLTEEVTGVGKYVSDWWFKFAASEERDKLNSVDSEEQVEIGERLGSYLEESTNWQFIINKKYSKKWMIIIFIIWHSILMSWNYRDLRVKYNWQTQDRPKCPLICTYLRWPISRHLLVVDSIELTGDTGKYILCCVG